MFRFFFVVVADGDKWKFVAEKLGLNPGEIRFLDERNKNPVNELTFLYAHRHLKLMPSCKVCIALGSQVTACQI